MEKEKFDLEKVYDEQINPLMAQIIEVCKQHNMPFIASFQYASDGKDDHQLCTSCMLPKERPVAPSLEHCYAALLPPRIPTLMLTTRDKDGNVTQMTAIVP